MIIACLALNAHPVVARGLDPRAYPLRGPPPRWGGAAGGAPGAQTAFGRRDG
jgi:hypothetical protein